MLMAIPVIIKLIAIIKRCFICTSTFYISSSSKKAYYNSTMFYHTNPQKSWKRPEWL